MVWKDCSSKLIAKILPGHDFCHVRFEGVMDVVNVFEYQGLICLLILDNLFVKGAFGGNHLEHI